MDAYQVLPTRVHFGGYLCNVVKGQYANRATAIQLADAIDDSPVTTASVNIPGISENLPENEMVLKSYSENEGMLEALVDAGIVEDTGRRVHSRYVEMPVVRLVGGTSS